MQQQNGAGGWGNHWFNLCCTEFILGNIHIDSLVQDCSNPSALAMEFLQSCTKPSKCVCVCWHFSSQRLHFFFFFFFRFIYCHTIHSDASYYRSTTDHIIKTSKETHLIQNYLETNIPNAWDCCNICIYCNHRSKQTNRKKVNHKYICFIIPNTKKHYIVFILYLHSYWLSPVS